MFSWRGPAHRSAIAPIGPRASGQPPTKVASVTTEPIDRAAPWPQPTLTGRSVALVPLRRDHAAALLDAAADGELWTPHGDRRSRPPRRSRIISTPPLTQRDAGTAMPFVVIDRSTGRPCGSTRFWKIDRPNRKLEIGHSWLSRSSQRSGINTEAKYLLLTHAFEAMACVRVQFTTDERNAASRAAILRIGARQEGIVRHERIMPDGRKRNSVRFSIIDPEWPEVKALLERKMGW